MNKGNFFGTIIFVINFRFEWNQVPRRIYSEKKAIEVGMKFDSKLKLLISMRIRKDEWKINQPHDYL